MAEDWTPQENARNTAWFRIWLPEGKEEEFTNMTGMKLKKPPIVHVCGFDGDRLKWEKDVTGLA